MERKSTKRQGGLWAIPGYWHAFVSLFRREDGFTLVELFVVLGIIGILIFAVFTILDPFGQLAKGNDAKRKSDLSQVQKALETYYQDTGRYPEHSLSPMYRIVRLDDSTADWGQQFSPYMSTLPEDPKPIFNYVYFASSNGQAYWLYASLEKTTDPQTCNGGNPCASLTSNGIPDNACGGTCNYAAASSNVNP